VPTALEKLLGEFPAEDFQRLVETRRDLHRHPELAFEETRTAAVAARRLKQAGWTPREGVGKTGVTADRGSATSGKPGRILLRADMDALPLAEETGAAYASTVPGKMHACGHDGHVAIAISLAERLASHPAAAGFRFLFQPAEEGAGGAEACASDGILEGVTLAFGLHLWNQLPLGKVGVNRRALMAAVDEFSIDVTGPGGHGASPHETSDTILAASRIVEALQSVVAREISPLDSAVVTIGSIHGGSSFNIIPSQVRLTGTARSFTEAVGDALPKKIERIVAGTAKAAGVEAKLHYRRVNRATVNDRATAELVIETAGRLLGSENVESETRTLGGEDMSVFLDRVPGCFFFVGSAPANGHRPHHSPRFDIDERALVVGLRLFEEVALEAARRI
jgi:amidohydrolase